MIALKKIFGYLLVYYLFLMPFRESFLIIAVITLPFFFYLMNKDIKLFFLVFIAFLLTFKSLIVYLDFTQQIELFPVIISFMTVSTLFNKNNLIKFSNNRSVTRVIYYFLALFVLLLLSSALNSSSIPGMIISFGWTIYGLMIYLVAYYHKSLDRSFLYEIGRLIFLIMMFQLPIQILQMVDTPLFTGAYADKYSGTLGMAGTSILAVYYIFIAQCALIYALRNKLTISILIIFAVIIISSIIGDMSFVKFALVGTPVFVVIAMGSSALRKGGGMKFIGIVTIMLAGVFGLISFQESSQVFQKDKASFSIAAMMDPARIISNQEIQYSSKEGLKVGRKLGLAISTVNLLRGDFPTLLFGYGPESTRSRKSGAFGNVSSKKTTTLFQVNFFGLDRLMTESGILGVVVASSLFLSLFLTAKKFLKRVKDPLTKIYTEMYIAILIVFIFTFQYDGGWFTQYQKVLVFWLITGIVIKMIRTDGTKYDSNSIVAQ